MFIIICHSGGSFLNPLLRPLSLPLAGLQLRCEGSRPDESPLCPVKIPIFVKSANCQERVVGVGWWGGCVLMPAINSGPNISSASIPFLSFPPTRVKKRRATEVLQVAAPS